MVGLSTLTVRTLGGWGTEVTSQMLPVGHLRPNGVLLENVPDLAVWDDGLVLASIRESLRNLGYATYAKVLRASDFGVPQHRTTSAGRSSRMARVHMA